jgi:hypothetical protein
MGGGLSIFSFVEIRSPPPPPPANVFIHWLETACIVYSAEIFCPLASIVHSKFRWYALIHLTSTFLWPYNLYSACDFKKFHPRSDTKTSR